MKRLYDKALMDQIAKVYGNEVAFLSEFSGALLDIIREGLIRDGQVRLHQFGTFKLKWMKSRNGVDPGSGKKIIIQARPRVVFVPAKGLKERIEPVAPVLQPYEEAISQPVEEPVKSDDIEAEKIEPAVTKAVQAEAETDEPEKVVADIQDEIEVLEQVVYMLKTEADAVNGDREASADAEKNSDVADENVTADTGITEATISDVAEKDTGDLQPTNNTEVAEKNSQKHPVTETTAVIEDALTEEQETAEVIEQPVLQTNESEVAEIAADKRQKDSSEWLDKSVLDNIQEISELSYFKSSSTEKNYQASESAADNAPEILQLTTDDVVDINLDDAPETTTSSAKKKATRQIWFSIAAAVLIVLSSAVLFNTFLSESSEIKNTESLAIDKTTSPRYLYSYDTNLSVTETAVSVAKHVPVEIVNNKVELETLETIEDLDTIQTVVAVVDKEVTEQEESIVVTSEQYDELKRVTAEQEVFFAAMDHRLVNGDSLWRLAKKHYVNPFYWPHIYQANRIKINNPDRVKIGKIVRLPTMYGHPDALTDQDKHNIAMGYYYNYLYHKQKGNPYAYFSLIGVEKFDASLLIEYKDEIERSDVNNLALLTE